METEKITPEQLQQLFKQKIEEVIQQYKKMFHSKNKEL